MASGEINDGDDILHPLASLHWEHCHKWKNIRHTHFAVLNDRIALLTLKDRSQDVLYISSNTLQSWSTIILPYQWMSLTTYQSKFVAVGGQNPSSFEKTDLVFTSETGSDWHTNLPSMPTKRNSTSSVSSKSPELLVVAGGRGSNDKILDVVEVLLNNHWSTVTPLPKACSVMNSAFHDGNFYFLGGWDQYDTIYTCRYSSLISLCYSSNSITKVWSQFKAPDYYTAAVSYSSYLVSIDRRCTVRAYSTITRSWVDATSTRRRSHKSALNVSAAVLSTGEIVCAHAVSGVYRVKLSVSPFDPDRRFISNVLSRLEAVMGVQIISVLASMHSQLTTTSRMQILVQNEWGDKKSLPNPRVNPEKYVVEVISQWSIGHSHRQPTWRNLLQLLQDMGLQELSEQIEIFMEGELKYINAYRHYINSKEAVELHFLKFLFVGPPRLGKTTLRRRLMGEIIDLISAGEADELHPSTAAVETGHSVMVRRLFSTTTVLTEAEWCSTHSLTDEARILFHNFVEAKREATPSGIMSNSCSEPAIAYTTAEIKSPEPTETSPLRKFFSKLKVTLKGRRHHGHDQPTAVLDNPTTEFQDIPEVTAIFQEATRQPEFWSNVKHSYKAYLRMEDTGGQPELMDMLPALTIGPGLYLLFFSYEMKLMSEFTVLYQSTSDKASLPEQSSFTLEEMLLSTLSSISCCTTFDKSFSGEEINSDMREILESSKSVAYIVGTHKDKVSMDDISVFDDELQRVIRDTDFFKKNIVQYHSEGKLVISIDNMNGGTDEINQIRKLLETAMEKHFKKLKIPAVWLLFSLCLRIREVRTASIQYCLDLSKVFNMTPYETKIALWFLHHHAGVLMYFPNVPELEDLVIVDIQVVYDSVTSLILRAMCFDKVGRAKAENFRRTGQFVMSDLIAATAGVSGDFIPPQKLVVLMEYLHIVARIHITDPSITATNAKGVKYIMPCVLRCAGNEKLNTFFDDITRPHSIAPINVRYNCGFVPIGIFPAMISSLITNKSFHVIEDEMMKNYVQFYYGSLKTLVTFISRPKFYEVIISKLPKVKHNIYQICSEIRKELESTLENVGLRMNYGYFRNYQFAFECPTHPGREHLCVCDRSEDSPDIMMCLQHMTNQTPVAMKDCHKIWFCQQCSDWSIPSEGIDSSSSTKPIDGTITLGRIRLLKWLDQNGSEQQIFILKEICFHWKAIGDMLAISPGTLEAIEMDYPRNAQECCRMVLKYWLDHKGTSAYPATWKGFCSLLRDIELSSLGERIHQIVTNHENSLI